MNKKIIFYILVFFIGISSYSYEFKLNKYQKKYLQEKNPELLKKYNSTIKTMKDDKKEFAIFLYTSSSASKNILYNYAKSMYELKNSGIQNGVFLNGLNKKTYKYMSDSIKIMKKHKNIKMINTSFQVDPDFFKKNKLVKVPAMSFSLCKKDNYYPSDCETLFMIHGTSNAEFFVNKIIESDENYSYILGLK